MATDNIGIMLNIQPNLKQNVNELLQTLNSGFRQTRMFKNKKANVFNSCEMFETFL
jgi:hypothetical protein